jgi:predicted nucleotidyltransferase component of viral defense system
MERAGELSLQPQVVEKDYVLGWVLAGIHAHSAIGDSWVFKGGTCLKKVHFETYRFSEDLDFTLVEDAHLTKEFLHHTFEQIAEWIRIETGIEIPPDQIRFECYRNKRDGLSAEGRLYYRGPLQPRGSLPGIKLDLTRDETLVMVPSEQRVSHPYSDEPSEGIWARCYPFAEVFAEKVRALGERGRPRDLYDVINLYRRDEARDLFATVRDVLLEKCRFKGIEVPSKESVETHRSDLEADWSSMLAHQLPALPSFAVFWAELEQFFAWLSSVATIPSRPQYGLGHGEEVIRVVPGALSAMGIASARPLETVRFAAANHLCVDLDYRDQDGRRSTRRIEAYSLRRTEDGNIVLHAERADGRGHRLYRVDRILGAAVADQSFRPRFRVELTPLGAQVIPREERRQSSSPRITRRPIGRATGPRYIYQCGLCGRRFSHQRQISRLGRHKDKSGYACGGRSGFFVEVRH